jgi:hypothetical protein
MLTRTENVALWHKGNAFYALVCRVVLGEPTLAHARNSSARPANGLHSILADVSDMPFREFVVFEKEALKIEYLVCYTRAKKYCGCGDPVRVRDYKVPGLISETNPEGHRLIIACSNSTKDPISQKFRGGCGLVTSLPRCLCRKSKSVDFWGADLDDDGLTFRCKYRNCQFKQLVEQGKGTCGVVDGGVGVEDEDNYDYADPFIDDDRSDEDEYEEDADHSDEGEYEDEDGCSDEDE